MVAPFHTSVEGRFVCYRVVVRQANPIPHQQFLAAGHNSILAMAKSDYLLPNS